VGKGPRETGIPNLLPPSMSRWCNRTGPISFSVEMYATVHILYYWPLRPGARIGNSGERERSDTGVGLAMFLPHTACANHTAIRL
jgi:hypothetical protein